MILRILGEGQYQVPDEGLDELNDLDEALVAAVEAGDEEGFRSRLGELHACVRRLGRPLPGDYLGPSDLVLPEADATVEEVRALLGEEGLIPG